MPHQSNDAKPVPTPMTAAQLFNGYIGANIAFALDATGLFDAISEDVPVPIEELVSKRGSSRRMRALIRSAYHAGYVHVDPLDRVTWTKAGLEVRHNRGYFTWAVGGYGRFFRELGALATTEESWTSLRDGAFVARGSDQNNTALMRDILYSVVDTLDFQRVADLGCGNAGRLVDFCTRYPGVTGVGLDINQDAVQLATRHVASRGMQDVIELHCQDVLQTIADPEVRVRLSDVDLMTCFMMLHDLVAVPGVADTLFDSLRRCFPNARYFLVADTTAANWAAAEELPIFSLGFELAHAFMGIDIPTKEYYLDLFGRSGLSLENVVDFGTPNTHLYLLRA